MKVYLADNPQGKKGRNAYSLEEYELDEKTINERFAKYKAKYSV